MNAPEKWELELVDEALIRQIESQVQAELDRLTLEEELEQLEVNPEL